MRKVYVLGLFIISMASGAFAQRSLDWAVDDLVQPTQLNSTTQGTTITIEAIMKVVSGDSAFAGDTVGYQVVVRDLNDQVVIAAPNGSLYPVVLHKDMGIGDTMKLTRTLTTTLYTTKSANIKFQVSSFLINRGGSNPVTAESTTTTANNTFSKQITWWNPQGWGVSVNDVAEVGGVNVYPNPATDNVTIDWTLNDAKGNQTVKIFDINGRVVAEYAAEEGSFEKTFDVSNLEAGMYMIEVSNGEYKATEKLQILK